MIILSHGRFIDEKEITITAIRSQGSGGQHVNKTSTAIHLRFDIVASSLPDSDKTKLLAINHHLITSDGVIVIKSQDYRSQEMNREAAIARLTALITEMTVEQKLRKATRPTRASDQRRLMSKTLKSAVKARRGKVIRDAG